MVADNSPVLPGRLGSSEMRLRDDPRADPRMIAAMEPFGLADPPEVVPLDGDSPLDAILGFVEGAEEGFEALFGALVSGLPAVDGVTRTVEVITGIDGNDITLFIHRPTGDGEPLPGVLHLHGGGRVLLEAMIAGLPVLTTDTCGYAFHVTKAGAGCVLSSPFDQETCNRMLAEMLTSEKAAAWRANGLVYAAKEDLYSCHECAADLIEKTIRRKLAAK